MDKRIEQLTFNKQIKWKEGFRRYNISNESLEEFWNFVVDDFQGTQSNSHIMECSRLHGGEYNACAGTDRTTGILLE